jgi:hypothetical protein
VVLAKKTPFTAEEESAVQAHYARYGKLAAIYQPSYLTSPQTYQPEINLAGQNPFADLIASNDPYRFAQSYTYNVAPVSDNAPFFFFTLKAGQILGVEGLRRGIDWKVNLGVLVLLLVLVISLIAVIAFLIVPLAIRSGRQLDGHSPVPLLYFVAVGLGYILVEIAFIQRFVLFLGHPTYALTVVIFLLMLSSGAGSMLSRRWLRRPEMVWMPLLLVIVALAANVFFLPHLLAAWVGLAFGYRLIVSALLLAPLGLMMGMPFPTGLRALALRGSVGTAGFELATKRGQEKQSKDNAIEWAWAMNAAASVLGSVLAMVIAIEFGLNVTLACGVAAYLFALALLPALRGRRA